MKRSILMFMIIGVAIIFSGCSKDNTLAPLSQNDQQTNLKAKKVKVEFNGVSRPNLDVPIDWGTIIVLPNGKTKITGMVAEWYDGPYEGKPADPMVTGKSIWYEN